MSSGTVSVVVVKAMPKIKTKVKPKVIKAGETKARIIVKVRAKGFTPTGKVTVKVAGKSYTVKLKDGKAVVTLKKFKKPGKYKAKVRYSGDDNAEAVKAETKVKVVKG